MFYHKLFEATVMPVISFRRQCTIHITTNNEFPGRYTLLIECVEYLNVYHN